VCLVIDRFGSGQASKEEGEAFHRRAHSVRRHGERKKMPLVRSRKETIATLYWNTEDIEETLLVKYLPYITASCQLSWSPCMCYQACG